MMTKHTSVTLAAVKIATTLVCTFLIGCGLSSSIIAQGKVSTKKEPITVEIDLAKKNPTTFDINLEKGEYHILSDLKKENKIKKYAELTDQERKITPEPLFPFEKSIVTNAMILDWQNTAKYGVWINEKKVPNGELKKYKAEDIHDFFISKLYANARKNVNYLYQIDITTNDYFKNVELKRFAEKPTLIIDMRTKKPIRLVK